MEADQCRSRAAGGGFKPTHAALAEDCRGERWQLWDLVIFIRHDGTKEKYLFKGTPDWDILSTISRGEDDICIDKTANDSFYGTDLESSLKSYGIKELCIAGYATDFCVNATVHSALVKDFNLIVAKDCHTTADRPNLKAGELIDFHNWLWENLTSTKGTINVRELNEIISDLNSTY